MVYFRGHFRPSEAEIAYFREHLLKQILQRSLQFLFALRAKARQSFAHMCLWPCALKKERTHMVRLQSRVSRAGGAREKRQTQRANARVNLRQGTVPRNPASA